MGEYTCRIPLTIRVHGIPDEERLAQMAGEIAHALAEVLARADRAIALREGGAGWHKVYRQPEVRLHGRTLEPALAMRVEQEARSAVLRALGGPGAPRRRSSGPARKDPVNWDAIRSRLLVSVHLPGQEQERQEAVAMLVDGIRHGGAQLVIQETLQHESPPLRAAMIEGLRQVRDGMEIAWRLPLRGLVRHGDTLALNCFDDWLERAPDALVAFLAAILGGPAGPERAGAALVVLHCLELPQDAERRVRPPALERLRALAAAHSLFGSGPDDNRR